MPNFAPMKTRSVILGALLLTVAIGGFFVYRATRPPVMPTASKRAGVAGAKPPSVDAMVVVPSAYSESVTLTGSVVADQSVDLRPEVAGRIIRIGFVEGKDVRVGQVLVKLNDAELLARRTKLQQQLVLEQNRKQRLEKLRAIDGVSLDEYEQAVAQTEIRMAELRELDAQIDKTEVRAPFTGRVGLRQVSVGAIVTPQTLLATLTSTGVQNIDCSVPERFASSLHDGATLHFRVRGADTSVRIARVVAIEPNVDVRTRTQRVRARIAQHGRLFPGMFADVYLSLAKTPNAILIPTESVVQDLQGASVFRMEYGIAKSIPVTLGTRTPSRVHVLSGLRAGDTIVTSGILFVKNGMPAKATIR